MFDLTCIINFNKKVIASTLIFFLSVYLFFLYINICLNGNNLENLLTRINTMKYSEQILMRIMTKKY